MLLGFVSSYTRHIGLADGFLGRVTSWVSSKIALVITGFMLFHIIIDRCLNSWEKSKFMLCKTAG